MGFFIVVFFVVAAVKSGLASINVFIVKLFIIITPNSELGHFVLYDFIKKQGSVYLQQH